MPIYEIIYILTIPIYLFSLQKLMKIFFKEKSNNNKMELISYLIYGILLIVFYTFIKIPVLLLIFNITSFFLLTFNYPSNLMKRFVCVLAIYIFLLIIEAIIWRLSGSFELYILNQYENKSIIATVFSRVLMITSIYAIEKRSKFKDTNINLPIYYYVAQIAILVGLLYLFIISINGDYVTLSQIIISTIILLLISSITVFVDERIFNMMIITNENKLLKQQNSAYENQFEIEKISMEEMKSIRHDIKNHILVLNSIYKRGGAKEFEEYISKIISDIDNENKIVNTNNFIVDSILNVKLKKLADQNVELIIDISIQRNLNILSYDLTIILSNLLDNAITAIEKCDDSKKISIYMHCAKGSLIILIDNSFDGMIVDEKGDLKTTKEDDGEHGIGINNVIKTVEKYNGNIKFDYNQNIFSVEILIPNIG